MEVQIKDVSIERATINGKNGSFTSEKQAGWVVLPNGETRKIRVRVKDGVAYQPGTYTVGEGSFTVSQYGDLQLGALDLIPVHARAATASQRQAG